MECTQCGKRIYRGDKYYYCENSDVMRVIENNRDNNIFCSRTCFGDYIELYEYINEEEDPVAESEDNEYDPIREQENRELREQKNKED